MKIIVRLIGLFIFLLVFIIPKESNLEIDGYLKIGRPFVYYWQTNAKTVNGIKEEFILENLILNISIYCFFLLLLIKILKKIKSRR